MNKPGPAHQVFWYAQQPEAEQLRSAITADVVIVGGGMAGMSAAYRFAQEGKHVVLLEQYYCGGGATGKSSGFITADSEVNLTHMIDLYGKTGAHRIWELGNSGTELIRTIVKEHGLECEYQEQDTSVLANSAAGFKEISQEHASRLEMGYESNLYTKQQLHAVVGTDQYYGALRYGPTFGINAFAYCQALKQVLKKMGVLVYEETPALTIEPRRVNTTHGSVAAEHVIVCTDQYAPKINVLKDDVFHAQTFLTMSAPLTPEQIAQIYPAGRVMAWDTDMIYTYFRSTPQNRILLGGANLLYTYDTKEKFHAPSMLKKFQNYWHSKFPHIPLQIEYMWPGLIGISKDMIPLAGHDKNHKSIYYISACSGLPWAAAIGNYCVEHIVHGRRDFDTYFNPYRSYIMRPWMQALLGKRLTFAINNAFTLLR
ncbi:oxidoreductase [Candidatus Dependentiae bacterium Noda2021]|nr:oxidoreductase [Candidatus Dependentiae bacterium Noda2021]